MGTFALFCLCPLYTQVSLPLGLADIRQPDRPDEIHWNPKGEGIDGPGRLEGDCDFADQRAVIGRPKKSM
jgi:hypothetical protein